MTDSYTPQTAALLAEKHPFRQWRTWSIPGTQLTLTGYSRSNDKTFFHIPELRCALDAALCEGRQPEHVFITHTHNDHIADIEFLASRSGGVDMYVPDQAKPYVEAYLKARRELNHMAPFNPELAGDLRLHGVTPGDEISIGKRSQYKITTVQCQHKIPCVGYAFAERRTRLKAELQQRKEELSPAEFGKFIAAQRKAGVEINETFEEPLFVFLGDTHANVFNDNPWLFDYPVIITECTFLDDKEEQRADQMGHTHWKHLKPHIQAHPEQLFVLIHFSLRHSDNDVIGFFQEEARKAAKNGEKPLENIVLWASNETLLPEQHQASS